MKRMMGRKVDSVSDGGKGQSKQPSMRKWNWRFLALMSREGCASSSLPTHDDGVKLQMQTQTFCVYSIWIEQIKDLYFEV